jgi:hypothetical protein
MAHDETTKILTALMESLNKHMADHPHSTGRRKNRGKAPQEAKTATEQSVTGSHRISRNKQAYLTTKRLEDCMLDILDGIGVGGDGRLSFEAKCEEIKNDHLEREEREKDAVNEKAVKDAERATTAIGKVTQHMARDHTQLELQKAQLLLANLKKGVDPQTYETAVTDSNKQASDAVKPPHLPVHKEEAHPEGVHDAGSDLQKELVKPS